MELVANKNEKSNFFKKLVNLPLGYSIGLVALTAILACWCVAEIFSIIQIILKNLQNEELDIGLFALTAGKNIAMVSVFIGVFLVWVIYALGCFVFMKIFGKNEPFERMLSVSALRYVSLCIFLMVLIFWLRNLTPSEIDKLFYFSLTGADVTESAISGLLLFSTFSWVLMLYFLIEVVFMILFMVTLLHKAFDLKLWQGLLIVVILKVLLLFIG